MAAVFLTANPATPTQQPPLTKLTAQRLLAQVTTALDSTPTLTLQPKLIEYLGAARQNWGMPAINLWPYFLRRSRFQHQVQQHLERGEIYLALVMADSLAEPFRARRFLYVPPDSSPSTLRSYVTQVQRFLGERPQALERAELEAQATRLRAMYDFAAVLAEADTIRNSQRRTTRKAHLTTIALLQRRPDADSLLISVRDDVRRYIRDERLRTGLLEILWNFCRYGESTQCDALGVTPSPVPAFTHSDHGLYDYMTKGNRLALNKVVDSLKQHLTMPQIGALLLRLAQGARMECSARDATCGLGLDRAISSWLEQTDHWLRSTSNSALQDTLRTHAAVLLAGRDTKRAFQLLRASQDTLLNAPAYGEIARLLLVIEPRNAWYAFQRSGRWGAVWAGEFALQFRVRGDTANERRALARMDGATRMKFELGWAQHLMTNGQHLRARNHALAALDWWDPAQQPITAWPGHFDVFQQLGIYRRLIRWAEQRPNVTARSAAILAVVGSQEPGKR